MKNVLCLLIVLFSLPAFSKDLRFRKDVLPGLLIRAGGPGGMHSLPDDVLEKLCLEGVKQVFYLYPTIEFANKGPYKCSGNTLEYKGAGFISGKAAKPVLQAVYDAANSGGKGAPILEHCRNGWHATGEVAAYALKQFCGMSDDQAVKDFNENMPPKEKNKYPKVEARIRNFKPYADLEFSQAQKSAYCP
jgi:hypothetical protein